MRTGLSLCRMRDPRSRRGGGINNEQRPHSSLGYVPPQEFVREHKKRCVHDVGFLHCWAGHHTPIPAQQRIYSENSHSISYIVWGQVITNKQKKATPQGSLFHPT